jgi:hypothetical protein
VISNRQYPELETGVTCGKQRSDDFLIANFGAIFKKGHWHHVEPGYEISNQQILELEIELSAYE